MPELIDLGKTHYNDCYCVQQDFVNKRVAKMIEDTLLITEHYSCFTIGRNKNWNHLKLSQSYLQHQGVEVIEIDRGGDITYHGPGQIVIYPIMCLKKNNLGLHEYLRLLEQVGIEFLARQGQEATRKQGYTGVWVKNKKIASIGIGVKHWVSFHGMAINIDPAMEFFSCIVPCGINNVQMTSLQLLHKNRSIAADIKYDLVAAFNDVFTKERG